MWRPESVYDETGHLDEGVVHAWLDGALVEDAAGEVAAHAATCESCAARVGEARGLIAGASRVLGVLDAASGTEGRESGAAGYGLRAAGDGLRLRTHSRRRTPDTIRLRRLSLAAAAVFVFAAAGVVLRDGMQGDEVREAVTVSAPELFKAPPRGAAGDDAEAAVGSAGSDAASSQTTAPVAAPALPTPVPAPKPELRSPVPAPSPPPALPDRAPAAPATVASRALADGAPPPTAPAAAGKAAAPGAGAAGGAAAPLGRAKLGDRPLGLEAVTVTAATEQRAGSAYLTRQIVAHVAGCWRLTGTDTLFRFPVTPLDSVAAGAWFDGVRIAGGERAALRWRRADGAPDAILVQVAGQERQLRLGAAVDSLAANRARSDVSPSGPGVLARAPDGACP